MNDLRTAAQQALEALGSSLYPQPRQMAAIAALRAALAEPVQESSDMAEQLADALDSAQFYRRRCEAIQAWQSKMRDPERVIVCDILANGKTLDPAVAGDRYTVPRPAEPVQEPVGWNWMLDGQPYGQAYYGNPPDTDIAERAAIAGRTVRLLYTAPPQRKPLTEDVATELVRAVVSNSPRPIGMVEYGMLVARAIERAHGIGDSDE